MGECDEIKMDLTSGNLISTSREGSVGKEEKRNLRKRDDAVD
jgi:hypothetical protein